MNIRKVEFDIDLFFSFRNAKAKLEHRMHPNKKKRRMKRQQQQSQQSISWVEKKSRRKFTISVATVFTVFIYGVF